MVTDSFVVWVCFIIKACKNKCILYILYYTFISKSVSVFRPFCVQVVWATECGYSVFSIWSINNRYVECFQ